MSADGKKRRLRLLMQRSADELKAVEHLISAGHYHAAISRSYYAIFYAATAIMANLGQEFSKHQALISAFGKEFATKDEEGKRMHGIFLNLFDYRQEVDYKLMEDPAGKSAEDQLKLAREFHDWAKSMIGNKE